MFICLDCDEVFEKPKMYTEKHGLDTPPYEHWSGCPHCSGSYVRATKCIRCGEYFADEDGQEICSKCTKEEDDE